MSFAEIRLVLGQPLSVSSAELAVVSVWHANVPVRGPLLNSTGETIITNANCICSRFIIITKQTAAGTLVSLSAPSHLKPAPPPVAGLLWF